MNAGLRRPAAGLPGPANAHRSARTWQRREEAVWWRVYLAILAEGADRPTGWIVDPDEIGGEEL